MKRVCVIGAGAAGLCMARHLTARKDLFITSVFEQTGKVGGTWVYTDQVHSSMYKNLRTNLPKEIMAFPDFPFPSHLNSFTHHSAVQKYLEDYSDYFDLVNNIQFNSHITLVKSIQDNGDNTLWKVTVKNLRTSEEMEHIFDAVIVCNGHYSVPLIPKIPGLDVFPGFVVHSHDYRHPEDYKDLDIVLLGAGSSGKDIAVEIAQFARHVYLSHNSDVVTSKLPENLEQVKGIETVDAESYVHLIDGNKQHVDGIMFCTGYKYSFPFLAPECGITANDGHVTSLYKHVFNTKFPSMAFIGIPCHVCPFPQFHFQSSLVVSVLSGKKSLPSQSEMEQQVKEDLEWRLNELGFKPNWAHKMGDLQWNYNDHVAELAGCSKLAPVVEKINNHVHNQRASNLLEYRNENFQVKDEQTWESVEQ